MLVDKYPIYSHHTGYIRKWRRCVDMIDGSHWILSYIMNLLKNKLKQMLVITGICWNSDMKYCIVWIRSCKSAINYRWCLYGHFSCIWRCYTSLLQHLLPHEVLQYGAFPCALTANHSDLGKVQVGILSDRRKRILHSVNQRNQILHLPVSHSDYRLSFCSSLNGRNSADHYRAAFYRLLLTPPWCPNVQMSSSLHKSCPASHLDFSGHLHGQVHFP